MKKPIVLEKCPACIAHPQSVWFEIHWRSKFDELQSAYDELLGANAVLEKNLREYEDAEDARNVHSQRTSSKWQPIETAPKDGTRIIASNTEWEAVWEARWRSNDEPGVKYGEGWTRTMFVDINFNPNIWQPLPEPPINNLQHQVGND